MLKMSVLQAVFRQNRQVTAKRYFLCGSSIQYRIKVFLFFLSAVFLQATQVLFSSEPSIESILRKYEEGLRTIHSVRVHMSNETGNASGQSIFAFQNSSALLQRTIVRPNNSTSTREMLCEEYTLIEAAEHLDENGQKNYTIFVAGLPSDLQGNQNVILSSSCLFGMLPYRLLGKQLITDALRSYASSVEEVNIEGKRMFEVKGNKDGVAISAKFILNNYATLYSLQYNIDEDVAEGGGCLSFNYYPADFVQYGNLLMPHTYQFDYSLLTIDYEYDKNMQLVPGKLTKNSASYCAKIDSVEINPKITQSFFRISLDIPNGTPVIDRRAPHIEYIWYNGKIVPKTDEVMLAIARGGHKFMPGPDSPRFWFMSIGIILILIACGRLAYKHFTNKA
jgi:hypothetical protein